VAVHQSNRLYSVLLSFGETNIDRFFPMEEVA
jgi:hypothetical protein